MSFKTLVVFCAVALMVQCVFSASLGGGCCGCGGGCGCGCGGGRGISSSGGDFRVQSSSNQAPSGISVVSENEYQGELCLNGKLPFLGTVALQGNCLPTCGCGSVCYDCGGCNIGISEKRSCGCGCGCGGR